MTKLYFILSVAGWAWLLVVAVYLVIRFTILHRRTRGFEVIEPSGNGTQRR